MLVVCTFHNPLGASQAPYHNEQDWVCPQFAGDDQDLECAVSSDL